MSRVPCVSVYSRIAHSSIPSEEKGHTHEDRDSRRHAAPSPGALVFLAALVLASSRPAPLPCRPRHRGSDPFTAQRPVAQGSFDVLIANTNATGGASYDCLFLHARLLRDWVGGRDVGFRRPSRRLLPYVFVSPGVRPTGFRPVRDLFLAPRRSWRRTASSTRPTSFARSTPATHSASPTSPTRSTGPPRSGTAASTSASGRSSRT